MEKYLIGKAHQRIIREKIAKESNDHPAFSFFGYNYPKADIKKAILREVSRKEAENIILQYEWLGTMGITQKHYGIFFENELAGVICFGTFSSLTSYETYIGEKYKDRGIQLTRGACTHWSHDHSGSKLIGYGLREMKKLGYKFVVAFSDPDAGEIGTLYQATNWYYVGTSNHAPHWNVYYKRGNRAGKIYMDDRDIWKKYGFSGKQDIIDKVINGNSELELRVSPAKSRYFKLIGSKKENKEMYKVLKDKILPYPKRGDYETKNCEYRSNHTS
jgi:hypothetical protein